MPTLVVDGQPVKPLGATIYYRRNTTTRVHAFPPGFKMIAGDSKAQRFAAHAAKLPVGRVGTPADLGAAAVFLLTSGYMTGTVVRIDGGHPLV